VERGSTQRMPAVGEAAAEPQRGLGHVLAAAGGLVLFVSLFVVWYGVGFEQDVEDEFQDAVEGERGGTLEFDVDALLNLTLNAFDRSAWQAFTFVDILLALFAVVAVALAVAELLGRAPRLPVAPGIVIAGLGAFAALLILIRLLFTPNLEIDLSVAGQEGTGKVKDAPGVEVERHFWGPLFGFVASLAMVTGGLMAAGGQRAVDALRQRRVPAPAERGVEPPVAPAPGPPGPRGPGEEGPS
jgi:hypothetical protein